MRARFWLTIPALIVVVVAWMAATTPTCVPIDPEVPQCRVDADCADQPPPPILCIGDWACVDGECVWECWECLPEVCGDGLDNDCDGLVDEGCPLPCAANADCPDGFVCMNGICTEPPPPPEGCYEDSDCAFGEMCVITDDCCSPPGCTPWQPCPDVCVPCGQCEPRQPCGPEICGDYLDNDCDGVVDEGCPLPCTADVECPFGLTCVDGLCVPVESPACYSDADCAPGQYCEITDDCCPPPGCLPGMDCPAVCAMCGECRPLPPVPCAATCDCYRAGIPFAEGCAMMCPICDNYWLCRDGVCLENCGPVPDEAMACLWD